MTTTQLNAKCASKIEHLNREIAQLRAEKRDAQTDATRQTIAREIADCYAETERLETLLKDAQ